MTSNNIYLGCNELIILYKNGIHTVVESDRNFKTVFTGKYEECVKYCESRWIEYQESIIG